MSDLKAMASQRRANFALATLFSGTFVMGSAELLVVGVLNLIATDLHISLPKAGGLLTANALGLAIGGPVLTALTIRLNKRTVLIGTVGLFLLANLVPVLVADYRLFLAARVLTGALQGLFVAVGFMVGTSIVPKERMGRAISAVVSGFTVSAALGVPLGTLVSQQLGWRGSFIAIVVLSAATLIAALTLLPSVASSGGGPWNQARYAFAPRVVAVLFLDFLVFASLFSTLTYLVPFLQDVTGISGPLISVFLMAYGVATAVGSLAGGRYADRNAARSVTVATLGIAAALLALQLVGTVALFVAVALFAWGLFAMGMAPSLQYRVVSLAGPGAALASSLPASAANLGIAFGSFAGGVAIDNFTTSSVVVTGLAIAAIAVPIAWATGFFTAPTVEGDAISCS